MIFLCYPKCSTCKNAARWLDDHGIQYTVRHIVEDTPGADEIKSWHAKSGLPLKKFFNTSGLAYKDLQLKDKLPQMTEDEQLKLLSTNGMLIKRPTLIAEDRVLVGFKPAEWETLL